MKPILKKSLSYILASVLSITQAFPVAWRQFEKPIKIRAGENMYTAQLYITTDQSLSHKTWLIQDENGVVGDNINEENYYRRLARTATIARYTGLDRNLEEELDKQSREWIKLFLTEKSMDVSEQVIKYGSRLEGLLAREIASRGTSLPADAEQQVILEHATTVFEDYFQDLLERLYAKGQTIIANKLGLAEEIKRTAEELAERNLRRASFQLRDASKILEAHEGIWDIEEAKDFWIKWKRGLVYGLASVAFLEQMRNVNWQTITSNVTINFGEGAGLPLEEALNLLEISPLLFRNSQIKNSFNTLETEIARQKQIFAPIDELFLDNQTLSVLAYLTGKTEKNPQISSDEEEIRSLLKQHYEAIRNEDIASYMQTIYPYTTYTYQKETLTMNPSVSERFLSLTKECNFRRIDTNPFNLRMDRDEAEATVKVSFSSSCYYSDKEWSGTIYLNQFDTEEYQLGSHTNPNILTKINFKKINNRWYIVKSDVLYQSKSP